MENKDAVKYADELFGEIEALVNQENPPSIDECKAFTKEAHRLFLARFAPKPMTFAEAVEAMKQRKKARRRQWREDRYIYENDTIFYDDVTAYQLDLDDYEATDWQIFEEGV